jgi:hypothetical protein
LRKILDELPDHAKTVCQAGGMKALLAYVRELKARGELPPGRYPCPDCEGRGHANTRTPGRLAFDGCDACHDSGDVVVR